MLFFDIITIIIPIILIIAIPLIIMLFIIFNNFTMITFDIYENFENSSSLGEKEIKKRVYKNEASFNSLNPEVKPGNAEKNQFFLE